MKMPTFYKKSATGVSASQPALASKKKGARDFFPKGTKVPGTFLVFGNV
jgi:hypothetical protein